MALTVRLKKKPKQTKKRRIVLVSFSVKCASEMYLNLDVGELTTGGGRDQGHGHIASSSADSGMKSPASCVTTAPSTQCKYLVFSSSHYHLAETVFNVIIATVFPARLPISCQTNLDVEERCFECKVYLW